MKNDLSLLLVLVACAVGACASEEPASAPCPVPGEPCAASFCDSDGVCRAECPAEPCLNATVEPGFGCVYSVRPNGWTCNGERGPGLCLDGECVTSTG